MGWRETGKIDFDRSINKMTEKNALLWHLAPKPLIDWTLLFSARRRVNDRRSFARKVSSDFVYMKIFVLNVFNIRKV